jgi:hypothetical protein
MTSEAEHTMQELATAAAAHAEATKRVDATREARDRAIRAAAAVGESRSAIARTAGVSREIVYRVIGALVTVVAIFALSACGGPDEPASQLDGTSSTTVSPTPSQDSGRSRRAIVRLVEAGACFSISLGSSAVEWSEHMALRSAWEEREPTAAERAEFDAWIESLPPGCTYDDQIAINPMSSD